MNRRSFLKTAGIMFALSALEKVSAKDTYISLEKLKELANNQELVVAYNNGKVMTYNGGGIKPVLNHLEHHNFKNAYVYDKITGRASALLLAYGKCKKLYSPIISKQAVPILEKYKIEYSCEKYIDHIVTTRNATGRCIMETAVENIDDAKIAYKVLKNKFESLPAGK